MSVEETRGRVDCGLQGVEVDATPERFRGLPVKIAQASRLVGAKELAVELVAEIIGDGAGDACEDDRYR